MATYRDYALTAYQNRKAQEEAAAATARQALIDKARNALLPLFTDAAGKVVADPLKITRADLVDEENRMVVLTTTDGSAVSFAVFPEKTPVERYMVRRVDGEWQRGALVKDLDDVGEQIAKGAI